LTEKKIENMYQNKELFQEFTRKERQNREDQCRRSNNQKERKNVDVILLVFVIDVLQM
jgi:hypothetical protein